MPKPKLISFDMCPYVQRSVIVLNEKGVDYDVEFIDLAQKPDWFVKISPLGKVPVLIVGDTVLFESAIINEYLDEAVGGRALHPSDPLVRAYHRAWIEVASNLFGDLWKLMTSTEETAAREAASGCRQRLARFEDQLREKPFFAGAQFSLVDAAAVPGLLRLQWIDEFLPELGLFNETPKVRAWTDAAMGHDSVKRSIFTGMRERFVRYLQGQRTPTRQVDPSWLGKQAR